MTLTERILTGILWMLLLGLAAHIAAFGMVVVIAIAEALT